MDLERLCCVTVIAFTVVLSPPVTELQQNLSGCFISIIISVEILVIGSLGQRKRNEERELRAISCILGPVLVK